MLQRAGVTCSHAFIHISQKQCHQLSAHTAELDGDNKENEVASSTTEHIAWIYACLGNLWSLHGEGQAVLGVI